MLAFFRVQFPSLDISKSQITLLLSTMQLPSSRGGLEFWRNNTDQFPCRKGELWMWYSMELHLHRAPSLAQTPPSPHLQEFPKPKLATHNSHGRHVVTTQGCKSGMGNSWKFGGGAWGGWNLWRGGSWQGCAAIMYTF